MARIDNLSNFLTDVAGAIRTKTGGTASILPVNYDTEILSIETGITPTGTLNITTNGTHDVTNYASANVNVSGIQVFNSQGFNNDSWELISQIAEAGVAHLYYNIGDIKYIGINPTTDTTGYNINITGATDFYDARFAGDLDDNVTSVVIVGFNHYQSGTNPTKNNGIVLMLPNFEKKLYFTGYFGWVGGDDLYSLRGYLNNTIYNCLPTELQQVIKQSTIPCKNNYSNTVTNGTWKLFLPSLAEMNIQEKDTVSNNELGYGPLGGLNKTVTRLPLPLPYFTNKCVRKGGALGFYQPNSSSTDKNENCQYIMTRSMYSTDWSQCAGIRYNVESGIEDNYTYGYTSGYGSDHAFYCSVILFCV